MNINDIFKHQNEDMSFDSKEVFLEYYRSYKGIPIIQS